MDLEKAMKLANDYLSGYVAVFLATLVTPSTRFVPVDVQDDSKLHIPKADQLDSFQGTALNPKLLVFVALSLTVGTLVTSAFPGKQEPTPDLVTTVVLAAVWWLISSMVTHFACLALRGKGSLTDTVSVTLQLNSVIFVLSAFLSFTVAAAYRSMAIPSGSFVVDVLSDPGLLYQIVSGLLLLIYLPAGLRLVHGFGWGRTIALGAFLSLTLSLGSYVSMAVYEETHVFLPRPSPHALP